MLNGIVRSLATATVLVSNFSVGSVVRRNLELPVLPRSLLQADGYLGLDTLDGLRVTFDFSQSCTGDRQAAFQIHLLLLLLSARTNDARVLPKARPGTCERSTAMPAASPQPPL